MRHLRLALVAVPLLLLLAWSFALLSRQPGRPQAAPATAEQEPAPARPAQVSGTRAPRADDPPRPAVAEPAEPPLPPGFDPEDPAVGWSRVDLDAVRRALPDNRFWTSHAPTSDAAVLAERKRRQAEERALRTQVESGNASEQEVDAYFTHRHRVFTDGIEFTTHLIERYGDDLSERDLGLLRLARKLHRARLVELPREHARAQQRRERMEEARREWQAMRAAFGEDEERDAGRSDPQP